MTQDQNILLAKRVIIDNIYRSANLEGIGVTFAETYDIVNNINSCNLKPSEVNDIINLKKCWEYILSNMNMDIDLAFVKNIHSIIAKGMENIPVYEIGEFRQGSVGVSGTNWRPKEPNTEEIYQELCEINKCNDNEKKSEDLFLWIMKRQMFRDGNKRVANFVANYNLIKNGLGLISIPVEKQSTFLNLLVKYYETDDKTEIHNFIDYYARYRDMSFLSKEQQDLLKSDLKKNSARIIKEMGKEQGIEQKNDIIKDNIDERAYFAIKEYQSNYSNNNILEDKIEDKTNKNDGR